MVNNFVAETREHLHLILKAAINPYETSLLKNALVYSFQKPGKFLRSLLIYSFLDSYALDWKLGDPATMAIEMVHLFSLIHDDLPSMDNGKMRHQQPCLHLVFGEAIAILTGDLLIPLAFEQLVETQSLSLEKKVQLVTILSQALGLNGLAQGQALDVMNSEKTLPNLEKLYYLKTGALFSAALQMAGTLASEDNLSLLARLGNLLGLFYQIKDDLTELEQEDFSDLDNQRITYTNLTSVTDAKSKLLDLTLEINQHLEKLAFKKDTFLKIIQLIIQ